MLNNARAAHYAWLSCALVSIKFRVLIQKKARRSSVHLHLQVLETLEILRTCFSATLLVHHETRLVPNGPEAVELKLCEQVVRLSKGSVQNVVKYEVTLPCRWMKSSGVDTDFF